MAKEAVLQVRMDADLKREAEDLYRDMGSSFPEAVRIFAQQSVIRRAMPFVIMAPKKSARGMAAKYADVSKIPLEKDAFAMAMEKKHG